jgi:hypothetical protein
VALISRLQFDADCVYDRGGRVKVENQRALTQRKAIVRSFNLQYTRWVTQVVFGLRATVDDVMEAIYFIMMARSEYNIVVF